MTDVDFRMVTTCERGKMGNGKDSAPLNVTLNFLKKRCGPTLASMIPGCSVHKSLPRYFLCIRNIS